MDSTGSSLAKHTFLCCGSMSIEWHGSEELCEHIYALHDALSPEGKVSNNETLQQD